MTLLVLVRTMLFALRSNKPLLPKLRSPVWLMPAPEPRVRRLVAKVAPGVQAPMVIAPEVLLPRRTLVARTKFKEALARAKLPVPPAMPIVLDAVLGTIVTVWALPVPEAVPPI